MAFDVLYVFVGPSEMMLCVTKGSYLCYLIKYNIIWANQNN